jgi:hypothetical protein
VFSVDALQSVIVQRGNTAQLNKQSGTILSIAPLFTVIFDSIPQTGRSAYIPEYHRSP